MTDETLGQMFEIGNVDGYEPPDDDAYPFLEPSTVRWIPGPDGKRTRTEEPIYLFRLSGPGRPGKTRFGDDALVARATSVYPAKKEPRRRVSIAIEIPRFKSHEELRADIDGDDRVSESQKEETFERRKGALGRLKGRLMLLGKALVNDTDLKLLNRFLQSPDAEGAYFGASVSARAWCGTCKKNERVCQCDEDTKDIRRQNDFLRFYPASEATEAMPEGE